MLPINEIFNTIQGEANFTGTPSTFIRLQGCPVGCGWCDTKHTWNLLDQVDSIIDKKSDSPTHAMMSIGDILKNINQKHIVITGGEPCLYDLTPLTTLLIEAGYSVQIETSGTHEILCHDDSFVTVSPKLFMAGGLNVLQTSYARADEIKYPVGKQKDIENILCHVLPNINEQIKIWLQPISMSKKATKLCVDTAKKYDWRLSIQTHKQIGVR